MNSFILIIFTWVEAGIQIDTRYDAAKVVLEQALSSIFLIVKAVNQPAVIIIIILL